MQINRIASLAVALLLVLNVNAMDNKETKDAKKIKDRQRELTRFYKKQAQSQFDGDYGAYEEAVQKTLEQREAKRTQKSIAKTK